MVGLSGRGRAASTVIDLGEEGLRDGDLIDPYIDEFWVSGNEVRIPAGSYRYGEDGGAAFTGTRGDCSLIGSPEGVELWRPDDGSQVRPTIGCSHGTLRVENITLRGVQPPSSNTNGSRWRFEARDPDSRVEVVNVNQPDGSEGNSDAVAFMTYNRHRGTLLFKNCYVANFGNSSFYVNLGYREGVENPVIVDNCVVINANGAIRGGHNGSIYRDTTFVWRQRPNGWVNGATNARGIRWDHEGFDNLVENCHFYFGSGIGTAGGALEVNSQYPEGDNGGHVRGVYVHSEGDYGGIRGYGSVGTDGWSFEDVNFTGSGSPRNDAGVAVGDGPPDLRNEDVVWMPESETVRPGGASRDDGSAGGSTPEDESMFEVVSTDSNAEIEFAFDVDGTARKARASPDVSSVGEANDTIASNGDGTVTVEGRTGNGYGDAFLVDGDVIRFERTAGDSGFVLRLDGEDVTDQFVDDGNADDGESPSTFEIVSTSSNAELEFAFTVEGSAEKAETSADVSSVGEANDRITANGDGTTTVEGRTGNGYGDAFLVDGDVTRFERTAGDSGFVLRLDGEDVTDQFVDDGSDDAAGPSTFEVVSTSSDGDLLYTFTVEGSAEKAETSADVSSVGEANDTIASNGDGTVTVEGKTGNGYGDAYRVTGSITGFERTAGDSGFVLRLDGEDVTDELTDGGAG